MMIRSDVVLIVLAALSLNKNLAAADAQNVMLEERLKELDQKREKLQLKVERALAFKSVRGVVTVFAERRSKRAFPRLPLEQVRQNLAAVRKARNPQP